MVRLTAVTVCLMALVTCGGLSWAQMGTPNLSAAAIWPTDSTEVRGEARFWDGSSNQTYALTLRQGQSDDLDFGITCFRMETLGEDPIADAVRASRMGLLAAGCKWLLTDGGTLISLKAGLELPTSRPTGRNTATGEFAWQGQAIPTVSLPVQFGNPQGTLFIIEPRAVWFKDEWPNTLGGVTESYGDIFAVGGGIIHTMGWFQLMADGQVIVSGENCIDELTNEVCDDVVWSGGLRWHAGGSHNWVVDGFATNAFGPTPATSVLATPDQSIGAGISVCGEF